MAIMTAFRIRLLTALGLGAMITAQPALADAPAVVATIKPVHSLTAALMEGVAEPTLLIRSGGSPHSYAMRPSEARALERAEIVIWVGEGLETFLERPLETLAADARIVTLAESDGLRLLPLREGGGWDAHDHAGDEHDEHHGEHAEHHEGHDDHAEHNDHDDHADHDDHEEHADHHDDHDDHAEIHHDDEHGAFDMHVWLDPRNAAAMAQVVAEALVAADPENAPAYRANAARLDADLAALEHALEERLATVRDRPFVVFHDAYQYFEGRFAVNAVGSITVSPDIQPGAARLRELRQTLAATQARCVFSEPQFEPRLVETLVDGMEAESGVLDPLGAELPAGPGQYFLLMNTMADSLIDCLGGPEAG